MKVGLCKEVTNKSIHLYSVPTDGPITQPPSPNEPPALSEAKTEAVLANTPHNPVHDYGIHPKCYVQPLVASMSIDNGIYIDLNDDCLHDPSGHCILCAILIE